MGCQEGVYKPKDFATPVGDFGIVPQQLVLMSTDHNIASLQHYGEEQVENSNRENSDDGFHMLLIEINVTCETLGSSLAVGRISRRRFCRCFVYGVLEKTMTDMGYI
ncbi:hypothetical protein DY000_02039225 [Brassica cretica]|uniref:Uncharacterized protein n=1 Tax=Brassica cretica TaxID=69181 RepID=A0ABQ7BNX5_BRACR|nr:hypothetical protein DY000_02039225 [Brassica cretica]